MKKLGKKLFGSKNKDMVKDCLKPARGDANCDLENNDSRNVLN